MEPVQTPEPRKNKQKANHEQEREGMKGHNDPRYIKVGERKAPREARIRRVYQAVKRVGEGSELSTMERGSTIPFTHKFVPFSQVYWLLSTSVRTIGDLVVKYGECLGMNSGLVAARSAGSSRVG